MLMNILVVGNVLKDVYLSLDSRVENFEVDGDGVKWLDFGFNNSEHKYFRRLCSYGGAAVTLQVLEKMGVAAEISGASLDMTGDEEVRNTTATSYRYILTSDDSISYLVESEQKSAEFVVPAKSVDYLFIDRSAQIDAKTASKIRAYLDAHLETALVVYLKNEENRYLNELLPQANLIFREVRDNEKDYEIVKKAVDQTTLEKIVYLSEKTLAYRNEAVTVNVERIDRLTHLSAYSIAAATILGAMLLGKKISEGLKLARANLENATLDAVLSLKEMEIIAAATPQSLELIAATLMRPSKGILAADESGGSIRKKFEAMQIADTYEMRHAYRNIFFSTPEIEESLSGIILFDETARDFADNGESVPDFLVAKRIIPGIKVDEGLVEFGEQQRAVTPGELPFPEETWTRGLDTLPVRLREYYAMGLRFAKWRAAFRITLNENGTLRTPSAAAIQENCRILAEYAQDCQSAGLVPIVEPEVVYDGDYPITKCAEATGKILGALMQALKDFGVNLRACILKTNMVLAGKQYREQSSPAEVGRATAEVLRRHVPEELGGVVFLSGGQTPAQATAGLAEIIKCGPYPWPVTFSFARALQDPALISWAGDAENTARAQQAFREVLQQNIDALKNNP